MTEILIKRDQDVKRICYHQGQEFAILLALPTHVAYCINFVVGKILFQSFWQVFINQQFHRVYEVLALNLKLFLPMPIQT